MGGNPSSEHCLLGKPALLTSLIFTKSRKVSHIIRAASAPSDTFCSSVYFPQSLCSSEHCCHFYCPFAGGPRVSCSHQAQSQQLDPVPGFLALLKLTLPTWLGFVSTWAVFLSMLHLPFLQSAVLGNLCPM